MKKVNHHLILLVFLLTIFACKKENQHEQVGSSVNFSFEFGGDKKQIKASDTTINATALIVTIEDLSGNIIYRNKSIELQKSYGKYFSVPVDLQQGTYMLTKFMVIDAGGNVLQASPIKYSTYGTLVSVTLPFTFSVQSGQVAEVSPYVLSAVGKNPQDFGYASFSLGGVTNFNVSLKVYIYNAQSNKFELSDAHLTVASDSGVINNSNIPADSVLVPVNDSYNTLTFTIIKDGFTTWTATLTANQLVNYSENPLVVFLTDANENNISFVTTHDIITQLNIDLQSDKATNNLKVDWGDGTLEVVNANHQISHNYKSPNIYKARLSGNIESINKIGLTRCQITAINVQKAVNLRSIELSRNYQLTTLDLSGLPKLKEVMCVEGSIETLKLDLSDSIEELFCSVNQISSLDLSNLKNLKTLFCERNNLAVLDISHNPLLDSVCCYKNNVKVLDLTKNDSLKSVDCRFNLIQDITIAATNKLSNIILANNNLTSGTIGKFLASMVQSNKVNPRKGYLDLSIALSAENTDIRDTLVQKYAWNVINQ